MTGRPKVLLIAECANPDQVSVPLEGWSHAMAIRRQADVHIVTQFRNRRAFINAGLIEGQDFTSIDSESAAKAVLKVQSLFRKNRKLGWTTGAAFFPFYYYAFENAIWKLFSKQIERKTYDIIHRLTPLSPVIPSPIAKHCRTCGIPFMLGPLNGGVPWPKEFDSARRAEKEWLSYVRDFYKILPGYRSTRQDAAAILVGSRHTFEQIAPRYQQKCFYVAENAIDPARFTLTRNRKAGNPLRVVFVGRLVPYKGADILLDAAAPLIRAGRVTVEIIGDGPQMPILKEIVARQQLESGVTFAGFVPHTKLQQRLIESDVFAFPSIREFGGGVVVEAMCMGLTPVVVDYAGPAELVTPQTGRLIPLGTRAKLVERFRATLEELASNPEVVDDLGVKAMKRARRQFTWDYKAGQVAQVYDWVLGRTADRPRFPLPMPDLA